jgi:hypothetical protein
VSRVLTLAALLLPAAVAPWPAAAPADPKPKPGVLAPVPRDDLQVSDGKVEETKDGFLSISSPEVRAQHKGPPARAARLVFTYKGEPEQVAKLASGEVAHQVGLKLRAKDTCNVLYVMWKL